MMVHLPHRLSSRPSTARAGTQERHAERSNTLPRAALVTPGSRIASFATLRSAAGFASVRDDSVGAMTNPGDGML